MSDVYFYFKDILYTCTDNVFYKRDNWVKIFQTPKTVTHELAIHDKSNLIKSKGGAIWLIANGDICYRFSPYGKVHTASIAKINLLFSSFLDCNFKITHTVPKPIMWGDETQKPRDENRLTISINQLLLVEAEEFNPYEEEEFYQNKIDGLIYRNTFKPSYFLMLNPELPKEVQAEVVYRTPAEENNILPLILHEPEKSITLQYLYYLCGYKRDRFNYLINWLASFFKNLSRKSDTVLVLYGDRDSGKDILFNNIITPLFGKEYAITITDNALKSKNISKSIEEKLFYNLNNISKIATENETIKTFLQNLLQDKQKYAQTLITIEEPEISYIDQQFENYTVFQVSGIIDKMYLPDWFKKSGETKLMKHELVKAINLDLENFAKILKLYPSNEGNNLPFQDDDKKLLLSTLKEKLESFVHAIKNINIDYFKPIQNSDVELYVELQEDFNKCLIKQLNLIKYFNNLYPENKFESSRTFMIELRKIDDDFFKATNAKSYSAGKKYFKISTKL